jgi:UDP-glucuronate decarboxylase
MRVLVTGGGGFLGSHLVTELLKEENSVIVVDNFYTGKKSNLDHVLSNKNLEIVRHDVTEKFSFEVDYIFNLACPASPYHYQKFPVQTIRTSIIGALNALELATKLKVPIFQASTSEVYGDPAITPQNEEYWGNVNPIGIRACYDEGKRASETLFFDYTRQFKTKIRVARIFNTYGPRMAIDDGRVVSNFIVQALRGEDITIYGDGSQTRSFCYVDDLINGFMKIFHSESDFNTPINLGNPKEFTMLELAEMVIAKTNSNSKIKHLALPMDDPKQRKPDITRAQEVLEWTPRINLEEGILKTIKYFETCI